MAIRDKKASNGGGRAYKMTRSKISKGKDGYGKVVSVAREKLMRRLGYDPGKNTVAMHKEAGSHHDKDGGKTKGWGTRGENTAESNRKRSKKRKKK